MKKLFLLSIFFCYISAQANPISFERKKITKAMNEEVLAEFKQAMNSVFGARKYVMDAVDSKKRKDGGRDITATISLFDKSAVELSGGYKNKRIESFEVEFPEEATIDFNLINQLADNKIKEYLPSSFPMQAGVWVKNLAVKFGTSTYIPTKLSATVSSPSAWEPIGVGSFKAEGVELNVEVENPKLASRVITGTISAIAKLGEINLDLSSSISNNPDNNAISASVEKLNLKNLMNALLASQANDFIALIPDAFKDLELNKGAVNIIPFQKELKMTAESTIGNVLFDYKAKSGSNRVLLAMSPPPSFKFSSLSEILKPLDSMDMQGSHFVISNKQTIIEEKFINTSSKEDAKYNVKKGLNLLSNIALPKDISDVLKVKNVTLSGSMPITFNSISLYGKLDFEGLEIGDGAFSFDELGAGMRLNATGGIEMRFEGAGSFKTGEKPEDRVQIFGGIIAAVSPTGAVVELEAGLAAGDRRAEAPANCLSPQAEWTEPFGVPGVGIRALGIRGGVGTTFPYINVIGLGGNIRLGTVNDKKKHICGSLVANLNIADLTRTMLVAEVQNITPLALIEAFSENANITGDLRDALNTGIESAKLKVVLKEMELFGRTYYPGIALDSAQLTLAGIKGMIGFSFAETGISAYGEMDPYELKSGETTLFAIRGARPNPDGTTSGPSVSLGLNSTNPHFKLNAAVEVIGIEAETFIQIDKNGFEFEATGKVLDGALTATAHVKVGEITQNSGIYVKASFENRLQTMVADELLKFIETESKKSQEAYKNAKDVIAKTKTNNDFEQAFVDLAGETVNAFAEMDKGMAVAGSYVVEGLLKEALNVRKISFEGEINSMKGKIAVDVDMTIAGSELKETVKMELNINEDAFGDMIVSVIGDDVIDFFGTLDTEIANAFEDLGEELETAFEDLGGYIVEGAEIVGKEVIKGAEEVGKGVVVAAEYMAKAFEDFGKELENVFIGNSYAPRVSNGTPAKTPYNHTRFRVAVNNIKVTDDEGGFGPALELYGSILVKVSSNIKSNRGATPFAYGRAMTKKVEVKKNNSTGVNTFKDFYIPNSDIASGRGSIVLISKILEWNTNVDYDFLNGSTSINVSNIRQGVPYSRSFTAKETRGDDEAVSISYTITFVEKMGPPPPPPSREQIFAAVRYNKIAEIDYLEKKGGKIKQDGIIEEAIKAKVTPAMVERLFRAGNMAKSSHLALATKPQYRNPAMIDLLLRTGVRPNSEALLNEIGTGNVANADKLIKEKAVPQLKHVQKAISINNTQMIYYLMSKSNTHVGTSELNYAVNKNDPKMVDLFIKHGATGNSVMITKAIQNGNAVILDKLLHVAKGDNNSLIAAAEKNDVKMYQTLTDNRVRLTNIVSIQKAIDKNNIEIVKLGLEHGGSSSQTLTYAISKSNKPAMLAALEKGAYGTPVLKYAVNKNDINFFSDLLTQYKASPNRALAEAYKKNNVKMGEIALNNKASANTYIDSASGQGKADWVKILLANKATPQKGLRSAVYNNHTQVVDLLLSAGATSNNSQYIIKAAQKKNLPMIKLLVEKGAANPNHARDIAISNNELPTVKYLLEKGAKPTGLKVPSQKGWFEMVKLLVESGADPNEGLEHSTNFNKTDISIYLLDKGADPKDWIKYAAYHGNIAVTKKLLEKGAKPEDGNYNAVYREKPQILKILIDAGSDVSNYKLMDIAVDHYNEELIKLLINNEGNLTYVTPRKKNTYLHRVAEKKGKQNLVKLFIDAKLDLEAKNKWGETPLLLAVQKRKNTETIKLLIDAGANVNAKSNKGKSVLRRSKGKSNSKLLKEAGAVK